MTDPVPAGLSSEVRDRIHEAAAGHVGDEQIPGLVALVAQGDDVHVEALGTLTIGGPAIERSSLFRIASVSKPIAAAAALALVGQGLLALDEPVDRWLPELAHRRVLRRIDGPLTDTVPAEAPITLRQLLNFTFGFGADASMLVAREPWPVVAAESELQLATLGPPDSAIQPDPDTWIARFASLPLMAQPGERWLYSTGTSVLGVLLARAAGAPLGEVLRSCVLAPLAMTDTGLFTRESHRLATLYLPAPTGMVVYDPPEGRWSRPPRFGDAAAGLVSTVDDLHRFAQMLLAGGAGVLTPELAAAMVSDQLSPAQKAFGGLGPRFFDRRGWGFGLSVTTSGPRAGSYGWDGALGTSLLVDPGRDLVVIVLTQRMWEPAHPPPVFAAIQRAAYGAWPSQS